MWSQPNMFQKGQKFRSTFHIEMADGIIMLNLKKAKKGLVEKLGAISHFHCPF